MKTFCQKCGKKLNNSKICSNCGFENKVIGKRRWLKRTIQFLGIVIVIALAVFIFKDKLFSYYGDITEKWKDNFKLAFAEYEFAEYSFEGTSGLEIYKKHIPEVEEIYSKASWSDSDRAFFMCHTMNIKSECRPILRDGNTYNINDLEKIKQSEADWKEAFNNCSKDEAALKKCDEYRQIMSQYPPQKCQNCDEKISDLYKIASAVKDSDTASKLLGLVDLLRQQQAFYDDEEFIDLPALILFEEARIASLETKWKKQEFKFIKNIPVDDIRNKKMYWGFLDDFNQNRSEYEKKLDEKWGQINDNLTKINDYIAMLNGNLKLDLKTWQKYVKENSE